MKSRSQGQCVKRSSLVDALRGISILLVMLFHFDIYYHLRTIGRRSYEIYLFHLVVIEFMWIVSADLKVNLAVYSPLWLFAFLCVAYGVAYSIFRFWSEPMNHLIRQLLKRSAPPQAAAGAGEQWDEAGVAQPRNEPGLDRRGLAGAGPAEENRERLVHHALKQVADLTRNPTAQLAERQTPGPG